MIFIQLLDELHQVGLVVEVVPLGQVDSPQPEQEGQSRVIRTAHSTGASLRLRAPTGGGPREPTADHRAGTRHRRCTPRTRHGTDRRDRPNEIIAKLDDSGALCIAVAEAATNLIVDIVGHDGT